MLRSVNTVLIYVLLFGYISLSWKLQFDFEIPSRAHESLGLVQLADFNFWCCSKYWKMFEKILNNIGLKRMRNRQADGVVS